MFGRRLEIALVAASSIIRPHDSRVRLPAHKSRYNSTFDSYIALTFSRGEVVTDYQQDGGSQIYALFDDSCKELFRVIYNAGAYLGSGVRPQGLITAYYSSGPTPARPRTIRTEPSSVNGPYYRTDCPVYQNT